MGIDKTVKLLSARETKYNLGRLIDTARAALVVIEKGCGQVVVLLKGHERLKAIDSKKEAA